MDVGGWLRELGLGRYEPAFIENAIDSDVLPELTEDDLKKLGIPLGDRKRLTEWDILELPRQPPGGRAACANSTRLSAERGRVGWSVFTIMGLSATSRCPRNRVNEYTGHVTAMSLEPIGRCYGRWRLAARPRPRAL